MKVTPCELLCSGKSIERIWQSLGLIESKRSSMPTNVVHHNESTFTHGESESIFVTSYQLLCPAKSIERIWHSLGLIELKRSSMSTNIVHHTESTFTHGDYLKNQETAVLSVCMYMSKEVEMNTLTL